MKIIIEIKNHNRCSYWGNKIDDEMVIEQEICTERLDNNMLLCAVEIYEINMERYKKKNEGEGISTLLVEK